MAPIIAQPKYGVGTQYTLANLADITVRFGVLVGSSDTQFAIKGENNGHAVLIQGEVGSFSKGITLGQAGVLRSVASVTVAATGAINVLGDTAGALAIQMQSSRGLIQNLGEINSAHTGILMGGLGLTSSRFFNIGILDATALGVGRRVNATETLITVNQGRIESAQAYDGGGDLANAPDLIVNKGFIRGAISLGGGNDSYDGRGGFSLDVVRGEAGADRFVAGSGDEDFDGGAGIDRLDFSATAGIRVALDGLFDNTGTAAGDNYVSIENIIGSARGRDRLRGNAADNALFGGGGIDTLEGAEGQDTLVGGLGKDILLGDVGNDVFRFGSAAEGGDRLNDFALTTGNNDTIWISARGFGGGLKAGELAQSQFRVAAVNKAGDGNDRFIFRTTDQTLWFDRDGTGRKFAPVLIADLPAETALESWDIWLF